MFKKYWLWVIIIVAILVVVGLIVNQSITKKPALKAPTPTTTEEGAPAGGAPTVEQPAAKEGDIGKMTMDIYVEGTAKSNVGLQKGDLEWGPTEGGKKFMNFLQENGVTLEQYANYSEKITQDAALMQEFAQRVANRVKELSKEK